MIQGEGWRRGIVLLLRRGGGRVFVLCGGFRRRCRCVLLLSYRCLLPPPLVLFPLVSVFLGFWVQLDLVRWVVLGLVWREWVSRISCLPRGRRRLWLILRCRLTPFSFRFSCVFILAYTHSFWNQERRHTPQPSYSSSSPTPPHHPHPPPPPPLSPHHHPHHSSSPSSYSSSSSTPSQ